MPFTPPPRAVRGSVQYHPEVSLRPLLGMSAADLQALVSGLGEQPLRARQLYGWLHARRAATIEAMTDLPRALRARLVETHNVGWPEVADTSRSVDGTVKYLFRLSDDATVETVVMPEARRHTLCLSTQAGCALRCAFCLTGVAGFRRNLTVAEILGQVAFAQAQVPADEKPWNIVFMGMGEPLLNEDATLRALRILMDPAGFAIPPRRVTLSTVGILPALERLAAEPVRPNLAISLHAADSELRGRLMPIEKRYALRDVVAAAARYRPPQGGRVTFEYVLLGGVNDSQLHARRLARLLRDSDGKVNLIPLNPAPEIPFEAPAEAVVSDFCAVLADAGLTVSVRRSRGNDILAACGQLHLRRSAGQGVASRLS